MHSVEWMVTQTWILTSTNSHFFGEKISHWSYSYPTFFCRVAAKPLSFLLKAKFDSSLSITSSRTEFSFKINLDKKFTVLSGPGLLCWFPPLHSQNNWPFVITLSEIEEIILMLTKTPYRSRFRTNRRKGGKKKSILAVLDPVLNFYSWHTNYIP